MKIIDELRKKQREQIARRPHQSKQNRKNPDDSELGELNQEFIIEMDNYFTLEKPIKCLRDWKIGFVGTARFRFNWPQKELKNLLEDI